MSNHSIVLQEELALYEKIERNIVKYFSENELQIFYESSILLLQLSKDNKIDRTVFFLQLQSVELMTSLKLFPEYVLAYLLSYSFYVLNDKEKKYINYGLSITEKINILVRIGELLENNFGWFQQYSRFDIPSQKQYKIKKQKARNWDEQTSENLIKMYYQLAGSAPILVVKMIDRIFLLQNSNNLFSAIEIETLAKETLSVHSKIAEQLGIWKIKSMLDDISFKKLEPASYRKIVEDLDQKREEREKLIQNAIETIKPILDNYNIPAKISGRAKHIYGLYQKLKMDPSKSISEINDSLGIRIIVNTNEECYQVLSILHNKWEPVEGIYDGKLFRDWISHPKPNGYQSIHTTIILKEYDDKLLEVQIRTHEMHNTAENGPAAHWFYKFEKKNLEMNYQNKKITVEINKLREQVKKFYPIS